MLLCSTEHPGFQITIMPDSNIFYCRTTLMKEKFIQIVFNFRFIFILFVLFSLFAANQSYFLGFKIFESHSYTHYNNFIIFKQSFHHLIENKDLYIHYPMEHWDLFKYSPSFAFIFAPIAILPNYLGLVIWNLLNAIPLFFAIFYFPKIDDKSKKFILLFILLELMTSMQNSQSNGLIAALIILTFVFLEKENYFVAILILMLSVYIKLFGIVAFALLLLYPKKVRSASYSLFWVLVIGLIPCCVISFDQLIFLYSSWLNLIKSDPMSPHCLSVMNWLKTWFGFEPQKLYVVLAGVVLFCLPLLKIKLYKEFYFKLLILSSILIWIVIFNHKAESPTFIIAICGAAIWYFPQIRKSENMVLIILAFVFTSLAPTDIFPRAIRIGLFDQYVIKAVPCILIWLKLTYDLCFYKELGNLKNAPS